MRYLRCGVWPVLFFGIGLGLMLALLFSSAVVVSFLGILLMAAGIILMWKK